MTRTRFIVPNLFTGFNFLLGIAAILITVESLTQSDPSIPILGSEKAPLELAAWLVVWCTLLDKLDGFAAKVLKASSDFGAQFDSMADLVAFGVTPGLLVYFFAQATDDAWFRSHRLILLVSACLYMLCAALRLARFNAIDVDEVKDYFHGLASTFAGGFTALTVILFHRYEMASRYEGSLIVFPVLLTLLGLLMVSPFYLPKLVRRQSKALNTFQFANVAFSYVVGFAMVFPEYLYGLLIVYAVFGFGYGFLNRDRIAGGASAAAPAPGP